MLSCLKPIIIRRTFPPLIKRMLDCMGDAIVVTESSVMAIGRGKHDVDNVLMKENCAISLLIDCFLNASVHVNVAKRR